MSTVVAFVKQFLNSKKDIEEITFLATASEPSRIRLYGRLANQLAKRLGWKYSHHLCGGEYYFIISKPDVDQSRWECP